MIDFSTLQGLTIPEGVVTQIADASGRVLWKLANEIPIVLEVAKQSISSYAGETSYADNCVLLDIYPQTANSTVKVTYDGQSKILSFSGTNAQQVYFGTFNGVSDEVETPESGTLTIEGGCSGFATGAYVSGVDSKGNESTKHCSCITGVIEWGGVSSIPSYAFYGCTDLALVLPSGIAQIGTYALANCTGSITLIETVPPTISSDTFSGCTATIIVPKGCVEGYQTATDWSTIAHRIVDETYITFSLYMTTNYLALSGMTWAEWCESPYNDSTWYIDSNGELSLDELTFVTLSGTNLRRILGSDVIVNGGDYTCAQRS